VFAEGARLIEEDKRLREEARDAGRTEGRREGRREGHREGVGPLVRLFERRLSRTLTEAEQLTLVGRLDTVGPARLGDVVLDLDTAALGAWLADPDAR
jgi:flagellar biosynthesis/type III secretory pathway protein FliH